MLPGNNRGCARTDCARCHLTNNESRPPDLRTERWNLVSELHVISENQRERERERERASHKLRQCIPNILLLGILSVELLHRRVALDVTCNRSNKAFICRDAPLFVRLIAKTYETYDGELPKSSAYLFFTATWMQSDFS